MTVSGTLPLRTQIEAVTHILCGVAGTNRYCSFEGSHFPHRGGWLQDQLYFARTYPDAISVRKPIKKPVEELVGIDGVSGLLKEGNWYFFSMHTVYHEQCVMTVREALTVIDVPLIGPMKKRERIFAYSVAGNIWCDPNRLNNRESPTYLSERTRRIKRQADSIQRWRDECLN